MLPNNIQGKYNGMIVIREHGVVTKEIIRFYILFFLTVFSVYFAPSLINRIYFLFLLMVFWNSKKNYFWFVFVFILISQPGFLFFGRPPYDTHIVPYYGFSGFSISFYNLFFLLAFFKALLRGKRKKIILKKPLLFLMIYLLFLFVMALVYGMSYKLMLANLKSFPIFSLFISFPYLVREKEDFSKLAHLVFPIMCFIIFSQFFHLYTGENIHFFLVGNTPLDVLELQNVEGYFDFIRPMPGGAMLIFFSFIFSLFFIEKADYPGKKSYLYFILILSILSIFLSATRSWIIMFFVVFFLYSIFVVKKKSKLLLYILFSLILLLSSYMFIPRLKYSVDNSMRRLATVEDLVEGDVTAGGTLIRINKRLPKVLEGFEQSPIFGWGFSDTYIEYRDAHVGSFNLLLQGGIVGFAIFIYLWLYYLKMMSAVRKKLSKANVLKNPLLVLIIAFIGILMMQFTTYAFFAFEIKGYIVFFVVLFISFSEFFVTEALREEISGNHLKPLQLQPA